MFSYFSEMYSHLPELHISVSDKGGLDKTIGGAYQACKERYFGYIQEDAFVYKRGEVDRCFKLIESQEYDLVGTPMYCYTAAMNQIMAKYTPNQPFLNDIGYSFWQNFFFSSRDVMSQTSLDFSVQHWPKGKYIGYLGESAPEDIHLDVMANISFQLRSLGAKCKYVSQNLGTDDKNFFPYDVNFWQHVNSLSSIFGYIHNPKSVIDLSKVMTPQLQIELERRSAWWSLAIDLFPNEELIKDFADEYEYALFNLIELCRLNEDRIIDRKNIIYKLLTL